MLSAKNISTDACADAHCTERLLCARHICSIFRHRARARADKCLPTTTASMSCLLGSKRSNAPLRRRRQGWVSLKATRRAMYDSVLLCCLWDPVLIRLGAAIDCARRQGRDSNLVGCEPRIPGACQRRNAKDDGAPSARALAGGPVGCQFERLLSIFLLLRASSQRNVRRFPLVIFCLLTMRHAVPTTLSLASTS